MKAIIILALVMLCLAFILLLFLITYTLEFISQLKKVRFSFNCYRGDIIFLIYSHPKRAEAKKFSAYINGKKIKTTNYDIALGRITFSVVHFPNSGKLRDIRIQEPEETARPMKPIIFKRTEEI